MKGFLANLLAGIRMAFFLPVGGDSFATAPRNWLVLLLLGILVPLAADFFRLGWAGEWTADSLPGAMFPIGLTIVATALVAECIGKPHKLEMCLTVLLAASLAVDGLAWLIVKLLERADLTGEMLEFSLLGPLWKTLASAKALAHALDAQGWRRAVLYFGLASLLALPLATVQPGTSLWSAAKEGDDLAYDKKYDALTSEEAFYLQPSLLERALADLRKQRSGQTELFFVGLAGDAEQEVFLKEVRAVEAIMSGRFGTAGHAVTLVNNYQAATDYPLASVTGLRRTLGRVGEIMDKNDDILFLFITSHGSRDHSILLDFWPLRFNPLNPNVLRKILDESGIKWRVVVVSACYSGGFIEALRDDKTIVITAAAPDRSSFGCSDENDWTYFGKAFFDEALRHESDLETAFGVARHIIARREQEEQISTVSDPRIAAGKAMNAKWRLFAAGGRHEAMLRGP
jgi:hypothetical protein